MISVSESEIAECRKTTPPFGGSIVLQSHPEGHTIDSNETLSSHSSTPKGLPLPFGEASRGFAEFSVQASSSTPPLLQFALILASKNDTK